MAAEVAGSRAQADQGEEDWLSRHDVSFVPDVFPIVGCCGWERPPAVLSFHSSPPPDIGRFPVMLQPLLPRSAPSPDDDGTMRVTH